MKKIYQKLKNWYRGEHIPYTLQEMMDLQRPRYLEGQEQDLPDRFAPPLIARLSDSVWRFWLRRWPILLPIIVAALVALFKPF
jgi:hypothetical protein